MASAPKVTLLNLKIYINNYFNIKLIYFYLDNNFMYNLKKYNTILL